MELYADLFILINFLCDLIVLTVCARLLCRKVSGGRLLLSSALGALYALLWLLLYPAPFFLFILSLPFSVLMVIAAFGFHSPKNFFCALGFFYLICLVFGGVASGLCAAIGTILPPLYALSLLALCLFFSSVFCLTVGRRFERAGKKNSAELCFWVNNKSYRTKGLCDSGNLLYDPISLLPVVLLDPSLLKHFEQSIPCDRTITIKTAAGSAILPAFLPQRALIDGVERQICIALCPAKDGSFAGTAALLPLF